MSDLLSEKPNSKQRPNSSQPSWVGKRGFILGLGLGCLFTWGGMSLVGERSPSESVATNVAAESVVAAQSASQTVTVTEVQTTPVNRTLKASGTVRAYELTPVMSQAAGLQVTEILVDRGDVVSKGQVLARLNNQVLQAEMLQAQGELQGAEARLDELLAGTRREEIAQAQARVKQAQAAVTEAQSDLDLIQKRVASNQKLQVEGAITRDRLDELLNQERINQSTLNAAQANLLEAEQSLAQAVAGPRPQTITQARAELAQAQARIKLIAAQLEDTVITAPSSGIIAQRNARIGEITSVSEELFSIIEDGRLELRLQISETLLGQIAVDQSVNITADANKSLLLKGKVREIDPAIDNSSRQATVRVDLPPTENLKPGMFLRAAITTSTTEGQTLPINALLPQADGKAIAFILQDDNTVKSQPVEMGEIVSNERVEIISGLQLGDQVVVQGAAYLKDGDRVNTASEI